LPNFGDWVKDAIAKAKGENSINKDISNIASIGFANPIFL
jgi:hypothetical protein